MEKEITAEEKKCVQTILAIHDVMDILNGKWKVSIMACLCFKKMRYSELLNGVKGVSGKMLSRDLKELEANGLIKRTVLNTQPVTVEYEKTKYGATLNKVTNSIAEWGLEHRRKIKARQI